MNCRDFREFIDSYLSDELLTETNHDILRHLEECAGCRSEIEARRMVRMRLRSAVRASGEVAFPDGLDAHLRTALKSSLKEGGRSSGIRFGFGGWAAAVAAAAVVVVLTFGFLFLRGGGGGLQVGATKPILITQLPSTDLVNLAAEDHDHCAVKYASNKRPVTVAQVPAKFRDIADVVSHEMKSVLKNCDLIDSHSCKFGKTRFTHVILRDGPKVISVLVTDAGANDKQFEDSIKLFASDRFQISRFDVDKRAVFVISDLDTQKNALAAESLLVPIRKHLEDPVRPGNGTALLFAR